MALIIHHKGTIDLRYLFNRQVPPPKPNPTPFLPTVLLNTQQKHTCKKQNKILRLADNFKFFCLRQQDGLRRLLVGKWRRKVACVKNLRGSLSCLSLQPAAAQMLIWYGHRHRNLVFLGQEVEFYQDMNRVSSNALVFNLIDIQNLFFHRWAFAFASAGCAHCSCRAR